MPVSKAKAKTSPTSPAPAKVKPKVAARSAAASTKTASAKVAVKTVTLKQIGVELAAAHDLPKRTVETLFNDMIETIVKTIKKGSKVRISGIGILQVKKRAARMGRNPATGEALKIKASKKVSLSVARDLKEAL
jgi:DNA-binding protein HU-beta